MDGRENELQEQLDGLRREIGSDFCSLGLIGGEERVLRWKLAAGNLSERYKGMSERAGRGFSGTVAKTARAMPVHVPDLVASRQLHEYPILLAEKLRSAYAVPVLEGGRVAGVLLAGERRRRIYPPDDAERIKRAGERISGILNGTSAESPFA